MIKINKIVNTSPSNYISIDWEEPGCLASESSKMSAASENNYTYRFVFF